ncbi:MAG: carbohydrate ABC transporter permease [Bacillota bacterium]
MISRDTNVPEYIKAAGLDEDYSQLFRVSKKRLISKDRIFGFVKILVLTVFLIYFLGPFLLVLLNTFKSNTGLISNPLALPEKLDFSNYIIAFKSMNFVFAFFNTLIITVCSVGLIVLISAMAAYIFVRKKWSFIYYLMVASIFIPFQAIMIPLVTIYGSYLHLMNSKWTLIFLYLGFGVSFAVFLYHGFIKGIPLELEEAAMIDGCNRFQTFFKIVFSLLKPITTTIIILDMLWIWNDFLLPILVLQDTANRTLQLSTYHFFGSYSVQYSLLMAGLVMTMIPAVVVYLLLQKHIIKGIMQGAIK